MNNRIWRQSLKCWRSVPNIPGNVLLKNFWPMQSRWSLRKTVSIMLPLVPNPDSKSSLLFAFLICFRISNCVRFISGVDWLPVIDSTKGPLAHSVRLQHFLSYFFCIFEFYSIRVFLLPQKRFTMRLMKIFPSHLQCLHFWSLVLWANC